MENSIKSVKTAIRGEIVVVTGASGCLGYQTVKLLISHDDQVGEIRCLDLVEPDDSMLNNFEVEQEKLKQRLGWRKCLKFITGDIRDINTVEKILEGAHCVIHCAAKICIWQENRDQDANELESINIHGTETLLKSAVRLGVQKFVHVSSFESFTSYHTIYYATENTLPETKSLLFGRSGWTKKEAEKRVRQYSNNKLHKASSLNGKDSLNAVIIRFSFLYGEYDKYYISKLLEIANFFGGKLQRFTNIWIRQQPIYVGNAAWALIKAKQSMNTDDSISGEDFNITDETAIGDPFDFVKPYLESLNMRMTKNSYPSLPVYLLILLFFGFKRFLHSIDIFDWFTNPKKTRLREAMEMDERRQKTNSSNGRQNNSEHSKKVSDVDQDRPKRWHDLIKPQIFFFMCNSLFLNRTKASLRLKYEPLFDPVESSRRSIDWYKNHLNHLKVS